MVRMDRALGTRLRGQRRLARSNLEKDTMTMRPFTSLAIAVGCCTALFLFFFAWGLTYAHELGLEDLRQTRDRPLFSSTRRPPPKVESVPVIASVAHSSAGIQPPSLTLIGVVLGANEKAVIVEETSSHKPVHLALGDNIYGWRVTYIEPRAFVLKRGDRSVSITFPPPGNRQGTGASISAGQPTAPYVEYWRVDRGARR